MIAVVDDGVRISHLDLRELIWTNPQEIPANGVDDDGNGYVDDVHGWDVADGDNSVIPPQARPEDFYHGTHLAGIVSRIARRAYGPGAASPIRIMPVKALADGAHRTYVKYGYDGIAYAIRAGADIVLSAWGQAFISADESGVLRQAAARGILVVASAGNFPEGREQYPAAGENVLAVAALDREIKKTDRSNYGLFVDLAAPGAGILGAGVRSDTDSEIRDGTSQAAAMVAAAAAIVRLQHPSYSWREVAACLKNSADPIDNLNPRYVASLGAGKLNLEAAAGCDLRDGEASGAVSLVNPQGYLRVGRRRGKTVTWTITPHGEFKGLRFRPQMIDRRALRGEIDFYAGPNADGRLVASHSVGALPESVYVAGTSAHVTFRPEGRRKASALLMDYRAEPIDFSRLYCRDTQYLDAEGTIEDGSGAADYSLNSDCKWQITAPEGKLVRFTFTEFDTQADVDYLYFFDGTGTHERIMAKYSGPEIPPELTTWCNQVLVWFVTDAEEQGTGWRAEYRFVDP